MYKLTRLAITAMYKVSSVTLVLAICEQKLLEAQEAERQQKVAEKRARDRDRRIRYV